MPTGKQSWRFALLALAALAILAVIWRSTENHEPLYQGKPVSYWFREYSYHFYGGHDDYDQSVALAALQLMGTNALPYLTHAAFNTPDYSRARAAVHNLLQRLPGSWRPAQQPDPAETRYLAVQAISEMNLPPDALVPLVPGLQRILQATNIGSEFLAAFVLRQMGSNALPAVPQLRDAFARETRWQWRNLFAVALCRIDAQDKNALAYLITGLNTGTSTSVLSLGNVGPNARPAIPALLAVLRAATNADLLSEVPAAVRQIGGSSDEVLAVLRGRLASVPDPVRLNLCQEILKLNPADAGAVSNLIEMAQRNGAEYWIAIAGLTNAGPAAAEAVPHLRELLAGTNMPLRISAFEALKQLQAQKP